MGKRNMYKYGIMTQAGMNLAHRISLRRVRRILPQLESEVNESLIVYRVHEVSIEKGRPE